MKVTWKCIEELIEISKTLINKLTWELHIQNNNRNNRAYSFQSCKIWISVQTFDFDTTLVSEITSSQSNLKIKLRLTDDFVRTVAAVIPTVTNGRFVDALAIGTFITTGAVHRVFFSFVVRITASHYHVTREASVAVAQHALFLLLAISHENKSSSKILSRHYSASTTAFLHFAVFSTMI